MTIFFTNSNLSYIEKSFKQSIDIFGSIHSDSLTYLKNPAFCSVFFPQSRRVVNDFFFFVRLTSIKKIALDWNHLVIYFCYYENSVCYPTWYLLIIINIQPVLFRYIFFFFLDFFLLFQKMYFFHTQKIIE